MWVFPTIVGGQLEFSFYQQLTGKVYVRFLDSSVSGLFTRTAIWFLQDGIPIHFRLVARYFLATENFEKHNTNSLPSQSLGLNPLDFSTWWLMLAKPVENSVNLRNRIFSGWNSNWRQSTSRKPFRIFIYRNFVILPNFVLNISSKTIQKSA